DVCSSDLGVGRAADVTLRAVASCGIHLVRLDDLVDQSDVQRLLRLDHPAAEDEVLGPGRPDQAGQPLRAAGAGDDAEQDLGLAQLGVAAGDAEVTAHGQLAAGAQRVAGDRGDGGFRDARDGAETVLDDGGAVDHVGVGHGLHLLDVRARGEDLLAAVDDDGTHLRVGRDDAGGLPQRVLHRDVERVHLGPVDADRGDAVLDLDPDVLGRRGDRAHLAHAGSPLLPPPPPLRRRTPSDSHGPTSVPSSAVTMSWCSLTSSAAPPAASSFSRLDLATTLRCQSWTACRIMLTAICSLTLGFSLGAITCSTLRTRLPAAIPALTR